MENTDGMADQAKQLMDMLDSVKFDPRQISDHCKDLHWWRLCDLPFSTEALERYYNGSFLPLDTVVSNTDNQVKCLFCDETVGCGHVFTNWDTKASSKDGCWRQYKKHCVEKHLGFIWYQDVRLQLEFSKWEDILVPHILQCSLFDANKIDSILTQDAVAYLKDRNPIPLISHVLILFGHAHCHLMANATRDYFAKVMK